MVIFFCPEVVSIFPSPPLPHAHASCSKAVDDGLDDRLLARRRPRAPARTTMASPARDLLPYAKRRSPRVEAEKRCRLAAKELANAVAERVWASALSDDGREYFYHLSTNVTAWTLPPGAILQAGATFVRGDSPRTSPRVSPKVPKPKRSPKRRVFR